MTLQCAVLDDYQQVAPKMADWSSLANVEVKSFAEHFQTESDLVAAIKNAEVVVIMCERTPFRASLFAKLPRLQLLVTTGMRNAAVDLTAAAAHGVTVCGTTSSSTPPAELTWALLLGLARNLVAENNALQKGGPWQSSVGVDLYGKQLGLLGLGKIGTQVARVGLAFGMEVAAWSQNLTEERAEAVGVRLVASKEDLLERSDVVSLHLVLSERTEGIVGTAELARMRTSAFLINTSRARLVDQNALVEALKSGQIAGAGLDVFETEPLPADDVFRTLPNVLATPHLGYVTEANYTTYYREAVEDVRAFLAGAPMRTLV